MKYKVVKISSQPDTASSPSILVIYTGGTMGMSYDQQGSLAPFNFKGILDEMPALNSMGLRITIISFEQPIDSSNVTIEHWNTLADIIETNYQQYHGFVVLHGTDTLAYTASALSFMLEGLTKPVIFTGSQLPIRAVRSDAAQNLISALQIACALKNGQPLVPEVCVYFDYFLFRANRCKKVESQHFDAFQSENYPPLAEVGIFIDFNDTVIRRPPANEPFRVHKMKPVNIALLKLFPGMSESFVRQVLNTPGLEAVILETFGSGNAPTVSWFVQLLDEAINNEIVILNVSQCLGGRVMQGRYITSQQLLELGVLSGRDITTEAALAKMQFLHSKYAKKHKIRASLVTPMRGEMDN